MLAQGSSRSRSGPGACARPSAWGSQRRDCRYMSNPIVASRRSGSLVRVTRGVLGGLARGRPPAGLPGRARRPSVECVANALRSGVMFTTNGDGVAPTPTTPPVVDESEELIGCARRGRGRFRDPGRALPRLDGSGRPAGMFGRAPSPRRLPRRRRSGSSGALTPSKRGRGLRTWLFRIVVNRAISTGVRERWHLPGDAGELEADHGRFSQDGWWVTPPAHWADEAEADSHQSWRSGGALCDRSSAACSSVGGNAAQC